MTAEWLKITLCHVVATSIGLQQKMFCNYSFLHEDLDSSLSVVAVVGTAALQQGQVLPAQ